MVAEADKVGGDQVGGGSKEEVKGKGSERRRAIGARRKRRSAGVEKAWQW